MLTGMVFEVIIPRLGRAHSQRLDNLGAPASPFLFVLNFGLVGHTRAAF